jgi:hypothetical protein
MLWQAPHTSEVLMLSLCLGVRRSAFSIGLSSGSSNGPLISSAAPIRKAPLKVLAKPV